MSIICWFVLVCISVLDLEGTPVALPLGAAVVAYSYPVTVLGAVGTGWFGFFAQRAHLARLAPVAPPLHALLLALVLVYVT